MKSGTLATLAAAGIALFSFTWLVAAQTDTGTTTSPSSPSDMMTGMTATGMRHHPGMMPAQGMPGQCGTMSPSQCALAASQCTQGRMMPAAIPNDDPAALLNLKDQLKLTPDQQSRLQDLAHQAQTEARSVLTPTQLAQLKEMPATCSATAAACGTMAASCGKTSASACNPAQTTATGACPYMQSMMAPTKSGAAPAQSPSGA